MSLLSLLPQILGRAAPALGKALPGIGAGAGVGAAMELFGGGNGAAPRRRRRGRGFTSRDIRQTRRMMKLMKEFQALAPRRPSTRTVAHHRH